MTGSVRERHTQSYHGVSSALVVARDRKTVGLEIGESSLCNSRKVGLFQTVIDRSFATDRLGAMKGAATAAQSNVLMRLASLWICCVLFTHNDNYPEYGWRMKRFWSQYVKNPVLEPELQIDKRTGVGRRNVGLQIVSRGRQPRLECC